MNTQDIFPIEKQQELEKLIEETFAGEIKKQKNYFLLSTVGAKLSTKMQELGFGKATRKTFEKAPACFAIEKNDKGYDGIILLKYQDTKMPKEEKKPVKIQDTSPDDFLGRVYTALKSQNKTLDVPIGAVQKYFNQTKIVVPAEFENVQGVMKALCEKYGGEERDNGEGTVRELYLRLRTTKEIPEEVRNLVIEVARQYFQDGELVKNNVIGVALANNGVRFREYNYPDLTGFLRN